MGVLRGSPQGVSQVYGGVDVCSRRVDQRTRHIQFATDAGPSQGVRVGLLQGHLGTHPQHGQSPILCFGCGPGQQVQATEPGVGVGVGGVKEGVDDRGVNVGSAGPGRYVPHQQFEVGVHIVGTATCGAFREVRDVVTLNAHSLQKAVHDPRLVLGAGADGSRRRQPIDASCGTTSWPTRSANATGSRSGITCSSVTPRRAYCSAWARNAFGSSSGGSSASTDFVIAS